jgi:hypothetical protein
MTAATQIFLLEQHPLSAAFPSMPENELAALALDIETHGQREQGVLLDGMVLDGWHRYIACHRLGVQFKAKEFDGLDPVDFVISRNAHRRHLTASQKAHAVAACAAWRTRGGKQSAPGALRPKSDAQLAEQAGVSERTVEQAKATIRAGLGEELKDGKVSAKAGAEVAKLPAAKREKAVKAIKEGKEPPKPPKEKVDTKAAEKLAEALKTIEQLREDRSDIADTARELSDKLTMFETTKPDEQQKLVATLQKRIVRLEAEVERVGKERDRVQEKCNALIRQVKSLQKNAR